MMKLKLSEFVEVLSDHGLMKQLEEILTSTLPRAYKLLNVCKLAVQNRLPKDVVNWTFYKFEDNTSNKSEPFIVCIQKPNMWGKVGVLIHSPEFPTVEMVSAFENLIDWSTDTTFHSCPLDFWDLHLKNLCFRHAGNVSGRQVKIGLWLLEKDSAKEIQLPTSPSWELRSLEEKHVSQVMENWQFIQPHSEENMRKLMQFLPSCGLFAKTDGDNEELASFLLVTPLGLCNILYTEENHRGKGFAPLVIQWLAHKAAKELGLNCLMETEESNKAGQATLGKCGMKKIQDTNWYWYAAKKIQ